VDVDRGALLGTSKRLRGARSVVVPLSVNFPAPSRAPRLQTFFADLIASRDCTPGTHSFSEFHGCRCFVAFRYCRKQTSYTFHGHSHPVIDMFSASWWLNSFSAIIIQNPDQIPIDDQRSNRTVNPEGRLRIRSSISRGREILSKDDQIHVHCAILVTERRNIFNR